MNRSALLPPQTKHLQEVHPIARESLVSGEQDEDQQEAPGEQPRETSFPTSASLDTIQQAVAGALCEPGTAATDLLVTKGGSVMKRRWKRGWCRHCKRWCVLGRCEFGDGKIDLGEHCRRHCGAPVILKWKPIPKARP